MKNEEFSQEKHFRFHSFNVIEMSKKVIFIFSIKIFFHHIFWSVGERITTFIIHASYV